MWRDIYSLPEGLDLEVEFKEEIEMSSNMADEMLNQVNSVEDSDHESTVKLDKDTLRIVNKWYFKNNKETVSWLCKVADEALDSAKRKKEGLSQQ